MNQIKIYHIYEVFTISLIIPKTKCMTLVYFFYKRNFFYHFPVNNVIFKEKIANSSKFIGVHGNNQIKF